jgi:enoyl-CoA hydratase/carnithine racemase
MGRATELLMTGDFVTADEALRIGLYHRVVSEGETLTVATRWAEQLAAGPSFALEITKDALNREASMDLQSALESEAQIQASLMTDADFREAYEAFIEKRPPRFR